MGASCSSVEKDYEKRTTRRGTLTTVAIGLGSGKDFKAQFKTLEAAKAGGRTSFVKKIASGRQYACQEIDKAVAPCRTPSVLAQHLTKMCQLEHPHICKFVEAFEDADHIYLIYEKAQPVSIFEHIKRSKKFSENDAAEVCRQALMALSVCHEAGIVHGRLKPSNLILKAPEDDDDPEGPPQLKITKLGQIFVMRNTSKNDGIEGFRYSAPEVAWDEIKSDYPGELPRHASKLDIWSLGALMFHILIGRAPFVSTKPDELQEEIKSGYVEFNKGEWSDISAEAQEAIENMLRINACLRADAVSLLKHPWLKLQREKVSDKRMFKLLANVHDNMQETTLKRAVLRVIAHQLPADSKEVVDAEKAFRFLDKNGDGVLAVKEMARAMEKYLEVEDGQEFFSQMDRDCSGTINLQEFIAASLHLDRTIVPEKVYCAFKAFDRDGDGTVSLDEVEDMVRHLEAGLAPGEMADELTAELRLEIQKCANSEGKIDFAQFFHLVRDGPEASAGKVVQREVSRLLGKIGYDAYGVKQVETTSWQWESDPQSPKSAYNRRRESGIRRGFSMQNVEGPSSPKGKSASSVVGLKSPKQATEQPKLIVWEPPPPVPYQAPLPTSPKSPMNPWLGNGEEKEEDYPASPVSPRGTRGSSPRGTRGSEDSPKEKKKSRKSITAEGGEEDYPASPVSPRGRGSEDSPKEKKKSRKSITAEGGDEDSPKESQSPKESKSPKDKKERKSRKSVQEDT